MTGRESKRRHIGPLIESVRAQEIDGIAIHNLARWGRNTRESLRNLDALRQAGGFIISASDNLDDIKKPMGCVDLTQYAAIAQLQSDQMGQYSRDTHACRRSRGWTSTRGRGWGYTWDKSGEPQHTPDPLHSPMTNPDSAKPTPRANPPDKNASYRQGHNGIWAPYTRPHARLDDDARTSLYQDGRG